MSPATQDVLNSLNGTSEFLAELGKFLISDETGSPHQCHSEHSIRPANVIEDLCHRFVLIFDQSENLRISFMSRRRCVGTGALNIRQYAPAEPIYRNRLQTT